MEQSSSSGMSLDFSIPLNVKILIMRALDSLDDLDALSHSCQSFYGIRKSELWNKIQLSVVENGTNQNMNALLKIRRFKKGKSDDDLIDVQSSQEDEENEEPGTYLANILEVRNTIRWFSKKLLEYYRKDTQDGSSDRSPIQPSSNEIRRLEDALLEFWFHLETEYDPPFAERGFTGTLIGWVIGADEKLCFLQPDVPVQIAIHNCIQALLQPLVWRYREETLESMTYSPMHEINCRSEYHKVGMPNNLMLQLGLNGIQNFLTSPWELQKSMMWRAHNYAEDYADGHGLGSDGLGLHRFTNLFQWLQTKSRADLSLRPLWKKSDGISEPHVYKLSLSPWNQGDDFDYRMAFWDDQRLKEWGYRLPESIDTSKRMPSESPSLRRTQRHGICTDCRPEWRCMYSEKQIALRKARFGDDFID
ncbi:hypothetical protein AA313_de0207139 [Arthrobotrys entomopaga]|nr:hypothetical protein AA313_de0207139 [Arthrobotrys entomopaga]